MSSTNLGTKLFGAGRERLLSWLLCSLFLVSLLAVPAAQAQTATLSEIRIDQPGTDNDEYFELSGSPGASLDGLTYLVIGDGAGGSGVIEAVVDLTGSSIPASGFFVAAEATFTVGVADLTANLSFENSDNVTHMLVQGFSGSNGDDLDIDDDGVLDTTPWTTQMDCVALIETVGSGDRTYCGTTNGPDGTFVPGHSFLCPDGWRIGPFSPAGGDDTPGAPNPCQVSVMLSEIRIDQPGADNDEYFELTGSAGDSLDGLTYLVIGDGAGGSGVIEAVADLTGSVMPASGFFVASEATFTLGLGDLVTNLNFENSDNVTHMVVRDFTGANGDDLDTDDDGLLDVAPWSEAVDCIALIETVGSGDQTYCTNTVGPDGSFVPAHPFLCPDGWRIGDFNPAAGTDTPGAANDCAGDVGELVINEIDYDQAGTDRGEFIEIKNVGTTGADLGGVQLQLVNGNGGSVYNTIALPSITLAPGDYFVVCGDSAQVFGCDLDTSPNTNLVQNGAPDAVALVAAGTILDTVSYEGDTVAPFTEGSGVGLADFSSVDFSGISRFPDGVDTNVNNADLSPRCVTPGAANTADTSGCTNPAPPQLVINEVDYDQPGADSAEFVEILNAGDGAAELGGVTLDLVNGNGGAVYQSIALPALTLGSGDYFVVCKNATTVAECDLAAINSVQNGSPDAVALSFGGAIIDTVSYEGDVAAPYTEGSGAGLVDSGSSGQDFRGIGRFPDGTDTDVNNVDFANACITPGRANTSLTAGCTATAPLLEVFEIQGAGSTSPFVGQGIRTVDNAVTAVGVDGFFIQTPTARTDGNIDTSDGIFVFTAGAPGVSVGDQVDVTGTAVEFFAFTELGNASVTVTGAETVPAAVIFDANVPSPDPTAPSCAIEFECYEGMLVSITGGTVNGPNQRFGVDPVAEVHITASSVRALREPGVEFPGLSMPPIPTWDGNPEVFELDPDKLGLPNQIIPAGSSFDAVGVIGFEFGGYELWPSQLTVTAATLPGAVRPRGSDEVTVGSLNLFRLFDDVNDGGETVLSAADYARRLTKFSQYIRGVLDSPDILAVQEVEKLGVLQDLAALIATDDPTVVYTAHLVEGNDVGGIDVGFLTRDGFVVDAVTQLGATEILTFDGSLLHDRPPLLIEGRFPCECPAVVPGGGDSDSDADSGSDSDSDSDSGGGDPCIDPGSFELKVMAIHSRSLGGITSTTRGPRVRQKRLEQAQSIAQKVQDIQAADPDAKLVVIGDFNAYEFTDGFVDVTGQMKGDFDPLASLLSGPDLVDPNLTDQVLSLPAQERYSFVFRGNGQDLDHALTTASLDALVSGFEFGRGNADAAVDLINDATNPLRSSDHDGLVLYIVTDCDGDGVPDDQDLCAGTVIPEGVPTKGLKKDRFALVDLDGIFDTVDSDDDSDSESDSDSDSDEGPTSFTVEDTAGCSCEQIIEVLDLGGGHRKHGCSLGIMRRWVAAVNP